MSRMAHESELTASRSKRSSTFGCTRTRTVPVRKVAAGRFCASLSDSDTFRIIYKLVTSLALYSVLYFDLALATMDHKAARISHPLASLSLDETKIARDVVLACHPDTVIDFRIITLFEPAKSELIQFLDLEHSRTVQANSPRPARLARVHYDVIDKTKVPKSCESIVDVEKRTRISHEVLPSGAHAALTMYAHRTY